MRNQCYTAKISVKLARAFIAIGCVTIESRYELLADDTPPPEWGVIASNMSFVNSANEQLASGIPREMILDALVSIATQGDGRLVGEGAVRAIFSIAAIDADIYDHLVLVLQGEGTSLAAYSTACRLLTYVADPRVPKTLLTEVKKLRVDSFTEPPLRALVDLGDEDALQWIISETERTEAGSLWKAQLEHSSQLIQLQQDPDRLLQSILGGVTRVNRAWAVRQSIRHAVKPATIRSVVLEYLRASGGLNFLLRDGELLIECRHAGILGEEDLEEFPWMSHLREIENLFRTERVWPAWTTLVEEKRAEFYRPTKPRDRVEPTVPTDDDK